MENKISSDQLFMGLVYSLTQSVFISLGKLPDPVSGKIECSLEQASQTIDLLAALMEKTQGNLKADEESYLKRIVSELRLNYVDELRKAKEEKTEDKKAEESKEDQEEKQDTNTVEEEKGEASPEEE